MNRSIKLLLATAAVGGVVFAGSMAFAGPGMWGGWGGGYAGCPYAQQGWGGGPGMMNGQAWGGPGRMYGHQGWGGGPGMANGPRGAGPGMMYGQPWGNPSAAPATTEQFLDTAKTKLAIRADQEEAWDAYVKALTNRNESREARRESMNPQTMSAMSPEDRLAFMQAMHETRAEELKSVADAEKTLLGVLDADQKEAADELLRGGFGPRMAQRGPRGHRGWGGGPGMTGPGWGGYGMHGWR